MAEEFLERQTKVNETIINELVVATPEWWDSAVLELTYDKENSTCEHTIYNEQHKVDIVEPTSELYEATHKLVLLFEEHSKMWSGARFETWKVGDHWKYRVNFKY